MREYETIGDIIGLIDEWGREKGLEDPGAQIEKFFEEAGEMARAHGNLRYQAGWADHIQRRVQAEEELTDAIGDVVVTLIQFSRASGLEFEECVEVAWEEIQDREGETVDGLFIKEG